MPHTNGFIEWNEDEILDLIDSQPGLQFYRSGNWPQLFTPCGCCPMSQRGFEPITDEQAAQWAKERLDV